MKFFLYEQDNSYPKIIILRPILSIVQIGYNKKMNQSNIKQKSIREKHAKGELIKNILKNLAIGGVLMSGFAMPNIVKLLDFFGATHTNERRKILKAVERMKQKKLVRIYEKNGREVIEITELGKKKVLSYDLENIKITRPKKWDGCWRIIIFDIPEKNKKARRALNFKLKNMEFFPLQKSVFVCPFECDDEVEFVVEFFGVKRHIRKILAKKIENDEFLKNFYNL